MLSDRDSVFTSTFWRELMRLSGAKLHMTSVFHPQFDGQTEAANKIIVMYLRCFTGDRPKQWLRWLPWAEYIYNMAYQSSLRDTPLKVVYGRDPHLSGPMNQARRGWLRWPRPWLIGRNSSLTFARGWNKIKPSRKSSMTSYTGQSPMQWATGCFYASDSARHLHYRSYPRASSNHSSLGHIASPSASTRLLSASICPHVPSCMMSSMSGFLRSS
jgi:hypothetical protein